jgi:alpha-amylase/alpha-mannosidase (GH57 family)
MPRTDDDRSQPDVALAVHGHFYQPPRENPWTEEVPREPSAAPFHDWNERIALEAYRPNAFARIVDDHGRVVQIVNNYEHLSFDVGPTLTAWLATHEPEAFARIVEADQKTHGGMAQAYFHVILPLAPERDVRTLVRWGMAEFEHRFGRRADGIWLPETAVSDDVLRVLAADGIGFTVLAPHQADRPVDPRRPYRWCDPRDPDDPDKGVDIVFYDGGLSHAIAFELQGMSSEGFVDRVVEAAPDGGLVVVAADGETFGHHHPYGDRFLAYALAAEAPKRHVEVTSIGEWLRQRPPDGGEDGDRTTGVVTSAWSCGHGVGRWREDCGCSTGGEPGWDQRWRAPLRRALDVVRDAVDEVYERRGSVVFGDREAARDDYVRVLLGAIDKDEFADRHVVGDGVEAFTLLEAARHALAMYTSCGWFFNDLAGLETVQVLRYAARAIDLLHELGEPGVPPLLDRFLHELGEAESNVPSEGSGRDVWRRHVETARVTEERAVAHLALIELLEGLEPAASVGAFDVDVVDHGHADRGTVAMCCGHVRLTHRRTGRRTEHVYAAVRLGGLEVVGATRPADPSHDGRHDREALARFRSAFEFDAPATTLVRLVSEEFGPYELGVASGLPDAADQFLRSAARRLSERFSATYEQLYNDHRATLTALTAAGYQLPVELRAPAELALTRRLEAEVVAQAGSLDPADYTNAVAIARDARAHGVSLDTPRSRATMERLLVAAVRRAVEHPGEPDTIDAAFAALDICEELEIHPSLEHAQEVVYMAHDPRLRHLAARLGLAPSPG